MGDDEVELRVMYISLPDILKAKGINPLSWHLIYEDFQNSKFLKES